MTNCQTMDPKGGSLICSPVRREEAPVETVLSDAIHPAKDRVALKPKSESRKVEKANDEEKMGKGHSRIWRCSLNHPVWLSIVMFSWQKRTVKQSKEAKRHRKRCPCYAPTMVTPMTTMNK